MDLRKKIKNFFTLTRKANAGFTLVELIVVIAILAILGGVAVPAYSGYVKKAERSADEALLNEINTAFASACMANGESNYGRTDVAGGITDKKFVYTKPFATEFASFFEGEDQVFKAMEFIYYNPLFGGFTTGTGAYAGMTFDEELINKVNNSAFIKAEGLGVGNLMDKVGFITDLAASVADQGTNNGAWQMLSMYTDDMLTDLGITMPDNFGELDPEEQAALMAPLGQLVNDKIAALNAQDPNWANNITGWDTMDEEARANAKSQYAQNQILASYAVLDAAKQMKDKTATEVLESIKGTTNFTDLIKDKNNTDGVSQAAAAYGLYTAYAHSIEDPTARATAIAKANDPMALLSAMNDQGFVDYLENKDGSGKALTDLEGYMAAMEMVNTGASDEAAVRNLIVNGFTDPELRAMIQNNLK
ncbi:MAG: prepilin-type N-terminal cleavage/methylation domain-containing protein [Clostridia bacterium]|nr:prepilin-type N-terminal cleavage/methylation domain-containing protein [Clostridia bacterium]